MKKNIIAFFFAFLYLVCACSPRVVPISHSQRIEYRDRVLRDSLYVHDSIYVYQREKNDTIYLSKYVYQIIYKDRFVRDTIVKELHDTTTIEVPVPARLTKIQQAKLDSYGFVLAALLALAAWTFRKPLLSIIKHFI